MREQEAALAAELAVRHQQRHAPMMAMDATPAEIKRQIEELRTSLRVWDNYIGGGPQMVTFKAEKQREYRDKIKNLEASLGAAD